MSENVYLSEQKYKRMENFVVVIAVIILVIGLCCGSFLLYRGIAKPDNSKVDELKVQLEKKKNELELKGVKYNSFAKYSDGEEYDLKVITKALDPSFSNCEFDEYKNNSLTKKYCSAKNNSSEFASVSSIMFGIFICLVSFMIAGSIFAFAKKRHILAFSIQQVMPIVKEGINEMTPTVGNAASEVTRNITKGVKEGLNNEK